MRSPLTATACAIEKRLSTVMIFPLERMTSGAGACARSTAGALAVASRAAIAIVQVAYLTGGLQSLRKGLRATNARNLPNIAPRGQKITAWLHASVDLEEHRSSSLWKSPSEEDRVMARSQKKPASRNRQRAARPKRARKTTPARRVVVLVATPRGPRFFQAETRRRTGLTAGPSFLAHILNP